MKIKTKRIAITLLSFFVILLLSSWFHVSVKANAPWGEEGTWTPITKNDLTYNQTTNADGSMNLNGSFSLPTEYQTYGYYEGYDEHGVGIWHNMPARIYLSFGATTEGNGQSFARTYYTPDAVNHIDWLTNIYCGRTYTEVQRQRKNQIEYGGTIYTNTCAETVTSTDYKARWTYPLAEVDTTITQDVSTLTNSQTGSFNINLSSSQVEEIKAWMNYHNKTEVYLCVGVDGMSPAGWVLRGCGVHGAVWWKTDGQGGSAFNPCKHRDEGVAGLNATIGYHNTSYNHDGVATWYNMDDTPAGNDIYTQDHNECEVATFSLTPVTLDTSANITTVVENGTIAVNDVQKTSGEVTTVELGTTNVISYAPKAGYKLKSVTIQSPDTAAGTTFDATRCAELYITNQYVQQNINKSLKVTVVYEPDNFDMEVMVENGYATYNGTSFSNTTRNFTVTGGSNVSVSYSPNTGYKLKSVKVQMPKTATGTTYSASECNNLGITSQYTKQGISNSLKLTIVYEPIQYDVEVTVRNGTANVNGTAIASGQTKTVKVNYGGSATVNYSPNTGYYLRSITEGTSNNVTASNKKQYSWSNIRENKKLVIVYDQTFPTPIKVAKNAAGTVIADTTDKQEVVNKGEIITYEISFTNESAMTRNYVMTDAIPANTTLVAGSISDGGANNTGAITWNLNNIAAGTSKTVSFKVAVNADAGNKVIQNRAYLTELPDTAAGESAAGPEASAIIRNFVLENPVKAVTNSQGRDINKTILAKEGTINYSITVTNPSTAAEKSMTITDTIPAGLEILSASDNGSISGKTITWNVTVPAGSAKTVTVAAKVTAADGATIKNTANVTVNDTNKASAASNEVENYLLKTPEKTVRLHGDENNTNIDGKVVNYNELLTYNIHVENPCNEERSFTITDKVPAQATMATVADVESYEEGNALDTSETRTPDGTEVYAVNNGGTYNESTNTVTWTVTLPGKGSADVSFDVITNVTAKDSIILNTAKATVNSPASSNEGNPSLTSNEVKTPVIGKQLKNAYRDGDENVTDKVVNDQEMIYYEITVKNPADTAKDFTVTDVVPDGTRLAYVEESAGNLLEEGIVGSAYQISDNGVYDAGENMITWDLSLDAGVTKKVRFYVVILGTAQNKDITNKATVYVDHAMVETENDITDDPAPIYVLEDPKKAVLNTNDSIEASKDTEDEKSEDEIDGVVKQAGDELVYYITFKNPAKKELIATVTDKLPADVEFLEADHEGSYNPETEEILETTGQFAYDYNETTHTITWYVPTAAKCQETVMVRVKILDSAKGKTLENFASIHFDNTTKKTNTVRTPVMDDPTKDVLKGSVSGNDISVSGNSMDGTIINEMPIAIGDEITYKVTFKNPSKTDEKVAKVIDKLPIGVDFVSATGEGIYDASTHTVYWLGVETQPQEEKVFYATVRVNESAASTTINNTAVVKIDEAVVTTITTSDGDPDTKNYVSTKTVYDEAGNSLHEKVIAEDTRFTYEITYKNLADHVREYIITDTLPEYLEFVSASANGTYDEDTRKITWDMEEVAADYEGSVKVVVKAMNVPAEGAVCENKASIRIVDPVDDIDYTTDTNEVVTSIVDNPVKMVLNESGMDIDDMPVSPEAELTYVITFINPDDEDKTATITDVIPEGMTFVSATDNGVYDIATRTITWTDLSMDAHTRLTVKFVAKVDAESIGKTLENQAVVQIDNAVIKTKAKTKESDIDDPDPDDEDDTTTNYVVGKNAYQVNEDKTLTNIDNAIVSEGDTLTYRIIFKNTYKEKRTFTITDNIPANVTYVSASDNPVISGQTVTWTKELGADEEGYVDIVVTVNKGLESVKDISNIANITTSLPYDPDKTDTTPTNPTHNYPFDPKDLVKNAYDVNKNLINYGVVKTGDTITYEIQVVNPSPEKQTIWVNDVLPNAVIYQSCDNNGVYDATKKDVTWELTIEGNQKAVVSVTVQVNAGFDGKEIDNKATVYTKTTTTETTTTENYVLKTPVKEVKSGLLGFDVDGKEVTSGDKLTFKITYTNPTNNSQTLVITDTIDPAIVKNITSISDSGVLANGVITWTIKDAKPGDGTVSFTVTAPEVTQATVIKNTATVTLSDEKITGEKSVTTNTVSVTVKPAEKPSIPVITTPATGDFNWFYVIAGLLVSIAGVTGAIIYTKKRRS